MEQPKNQPVRPRLARSPALACLLAALVVVAWPGAADSAPLRVVVLGQTARNAAGLLPGQDRQQRRGHPLPGRGPRHRLPGDRRRRRAALRGALRRQDRRLVDHPRQALDARKRKRPPTRSASSTNSSASPRRRGSASCARSKARKPPQVHAGPPEPARGAQPLLRQHPDLRPRPPADASCRARSSPSRSRPGRRCSPSTSPAKNTWRGSRLPDHCASKEDIQGGHPQQGVGKTKTYGCYYSNARLLYTATLVKKPCAEVSERCCAPRVRRPRPGVGCDCSTSARAPDAGVGLTRRWKIRLAGSRSASSLADHARAGALRIAGRASSFADVASTAERDRAIRRRWPVGTCGSALLFYVLSLARAGMLCADETYCRAFGGRHGDR